ncbi:MAG: pyrroline-5-carboxylate reductase dimerization domain-containing protein [Ignisphaera sp.]
MAIGIIGIGKLGLALVRGLVSGGINPNKINVYDVSVEALKRVEPLGVLIRRSINDLVEASETIVVSVKPRDILDVINIVAPVLTEDKILVSVAAFVPLQSIESYIKNKNVYRAMPNIAVEVNKGFIALTPPERRCSKVEEIFKVLGEVIWVKEDLLDLMTLISASTPAIVAELIDTFILAALKAGVPYDLAKKAIASVFQGVGKLAELKDVNAIRDSVITPRGSTIIMIEKLYTYGVKGKLVKALFDAIEEYLEKLEKFRKEFR